MNNVMLGNAEVCAERLRSAYRYPASFPLSASVAGMRSCTGPDTSHRQGTALSVPAEPPTT